MLNETPQQAARRLAASILAQGFDAEGLYPYADAEGEIRLYRLRCKNRKTGEKWIRPMYANGNGFELGEPKFEHGRKLLYRLPDIVKRPGERVFVVEGEPKVHALSKLGLVATTSGGAQSAGAHDWEPLRGREVIIWRDNDDAGKEYAFDVGAILAGLGCRVSWVDVEQLGLAKGGDVVDWLALHPNASASDLEALPAVAANLLGQSGTTDANSGDSSDAKSLAVSAAPTEHG
jgi:hypothetical protein